MLRVKHKEKSNADSFLVTLSLFVYSERNHSCCSLLCIMHLYFSKIKKVWSEKPAHVQKMQKWGLMNSQDLEETKKKNHYIQTVSFLVLVHALTAPVRGFALAQVYEMFYNSKYWICCVILYVAYVDTTCVETCPDGYFADSDERQCFPCHSACVTCTGRHSSQCLSCKPGWYRQGKGCVNQCPAG